MADRLASRRYSLKNQLGDRMLKQFLNSITVRCRDLSVSPRSIICRSLRPQQIIDLLTTDKLRYFAQPGPSSRDGVTFFFLKMVYSSISIRNPNQNNATLS